MDNNHLKEGYRFIEVKNGKYEIIDESNNKYSIVVDKNSTTNIIRVYYQKVFSLSVSKKVEDYSTKNPDTRKKFQFEIKITDSNNNPINGTYLYKLNNEIENKEIEFNEAGVGTFSLKHNDTITFINLPRNIKYKITELNSNGYIVEITNPDGSVSAGSKTESFDLDGNQAVNFLNITGYMLPETGSNGMLLIYIVTIILLGMPLVYSVYTFVKKRY